MAEQQRCMGCMSPLSEEDHKCPHCGYPATGVNPPEYLRVRTVLADRYLVGRVLEVSGDSAVYIALDRQDNSTVTIREFFPSTLSARDDNGRLQILGQLQRQAAAARIASQNGTGKLGRIGSQE